jgi:uncharacterized protein YbaR (Trm112 family)
MACHRLGARAVGVKPSHIIHVTREGSARSFGSALPLVCADGREMPIKTGTFDVVASIGVLEHITRADALVEEMARVLKPQGTMLLYFGPSRWWRMAQSARHRNTVYTYWTNGYAERKMRAQRLSGIKRVWTDVIDYRFRNDSFTNGSATLYGKTARMLEKWSQRLPVGKMVVLTCNMLEAAAFPRNIGLIARKDRQPSDDGGPDIDFYDAHDFIDSLVCPSCKTGLRLGAGGAAESDLLNYSLFCTECDREYPVVDGIPTFIAA